MSARPQQATPQEKPYNAADEEQVAERSAKSKVRDNARVDGLKFIMSTPKGRTWMRHLLAEKCFTRVGRSRPLPMFTGNSTTFYNSALRELGDLIACEVATACPAEFRLMEDEGETNG